MSNLSEAKDVLGFLQKRDYESKGWPEWLRKKDNKKFETLFSDTDYLSDRLSKIITQLGFKDQSKYKSSIGKLLETLKEQSHNNSSQSSLLSLLSGTISDIEKQGNFSLNEKNLKNSLSKLLEIPFPTNTEHPLYYRVVLTIFPRLKKVFNEVGLDNLDKKVLLGTRPHTEVNAQVISIPEAEEYIIAFQHGLLGFIYKACFIFHKFSTHPQIFFESWTLREKIRNSSLSLGEKIKQDATDDMVNIIDEFIFQGKISSNLYKPKNGVTELAITNSYIIPIFGFIFNHEYSHIILNHKLERVNWVKESQADLKALQLTLRMHKGRIPISLAIYPIFIFFEIIELIERVKSLMTKTNGFNSRDNSHPYPKIRKELIKEVFAKLNQDNPTELALIENAFNTSSHISEHMWKIIKRICLIAKARGIKLNNYFVTGTFTKI